MTTKLTLSLEKDVINKAKKFAKTKNKSLSKIIEDYLVELTKLQQDSNVKKNLPPITRELAGILKNKNVSNLRNDITIFLEKKYK